MKIISIANQKGGCGKTTTAINLASALGQNGQRVLLIDLDPQAHASLGLDIESQDSLYNVISNLTPRKLALTDIVQRVEDQFDIVPSNILVGTLEQELSDEIGRELKLKECLKPIQNSYDYVLIDCPPSLGILTVNSLLVSDELIIPVETSRFSMQGVNHLMDIVHLVKDRLNHSVKNRVLITMFDSRLRHSFSMMSTFREKFAEMLFETIIHVNVKLKESAVMGRPVSFYDKYCRGSKDYYTLAKEIIAGDAKGLKGPEVQESGHQQQVKVEVPQEAPSSSLKSFSNRMKSLVKNETSDLMKVRFGIEATGAKSVYVTGSFNDWSLDDTCRLKEVNGQWETYIPLKNGTYKYQFIVDGVWREDPGNTRKERNSFGDINSIIEVKSYEQAAV